jgi:hypothetical protein
MAEKNMDLKRIERRAQRYFYEDGLAELGVGLFFVIVGLFVLVMNLVEAGTLWALAAGIGLPVLIIGGTLAARRIIGAVKARVTYPRTGYVSYHEKPSPIRWIIVAGAFGLALFALLTPYEWADRMPLVVGLLMALIFSLMAVRVGVARLYVAAGAAALLGLATALSGLDEVVGAGITFGGTGVVLIVGGVLALMRYLRANPTPEDA